MVTRRQRPSDSPLSTVSLSCSSATKPQNSLTGTRILVVEDAELLATTILPVKAATDALHVAIAVLSGVDYLLTWNCTHIANAAIRGRIEQACRAAGMRAPIICTPEELTEA